MLDILSLPLEEASEKICHLTQDELSILWEEFYSSRPLRKKNENCTKCHNCSDCVRCYSCLNCIRCKYCAFCDEVIDGHFMAFNLQLTKVQWNKFVKNIKKLSREYRVKMNE